MSDTTDAPAGDQEHNGYDPDGLDPRVLAIGKKLGNVALAARLVAIDNGEVVDPESAPEMLAASQKLSQKALNRYLRIRAQHDAVLADALADYQLHAVRANRISAALVGA